VQARQQTALAFRVGGQIIERYVDVGDQVKVGQVLAKLDVKDAQLQLNAAKAQLESAQSAAKIAADERQRFKQLLPMNAVSRSQYDAVDNQYKSAMSALKQAQSNYQVTSNQTGYNQLIANKNGVITARNIEVGQVVAAGQAAYQMAIAGDREVVIGVPEQAISEIKVGQTAWVTSKSLCVKAMLPFSWARVHGYFLTIAKTMYSVCRCPVSRPMVSRPMSGW